MDKYPQSSLLSQINPASDLLDKVMKAVAIEKQRRFFKRKIFIFSASCLVVLLLSIPVIRLLISDLNYSGFIDYWRLAFADFSSTLTYWREWGLSILESLPALSLALVMIVAAGWLVSLRNLFINIKNIYKLNHLRIN